MKAFTLRYLRLVLLVVAVASLATVTVSAQSGPALTVLRVGTGTDDNATPLLYGVQSGMFRRNGLDVQVVRMNSGAAVAAAVAGGSLDAGKSSVLNIIMAYAKGLPFTFVAPGGLYLSNRPMGGMVVAPLSTIRSGSDLNGKTIQAAALRDINTLATRAWIDAHGGDSTTVKFVEIPPLEALGAIEQGRIDAATLVTPMYTQAISSGKARPAPPIFDGISSRYLIAGWFANEAFVNSHRDVISRFAQVMHDSEAYCNSHAEATRPIIAQFTRLDPAIIAKMPAIVYPARFDPRDLQPVIDTAVKYGALEKTINAEALISPVVARVRKEGP